MLCRCAYGFVALAMLTALALFAAGQEVISVRSGVIHFFEGSDYLNDQPLEPHPGKFQILAEGDELRTAQGRAEVLLTPGVILRIGEKGAIRMLANHLADTRVELLAGSAIVDSDEPNANTSVTLICKSWKVHLLQKGAYRIDSDPPRLWVDQGKAEVSAEGTATPVVVERGMDLPFAAALVPDKSVSEPADQLSEWSEGRAESISADNAIAAQISDDPTLAENSDLGPGLAPGTVTYFPLLGLSSPGLSLSNPYGLYSSFTSYLPGFSSIYLPGYGYPPFILAVWIGGHHGAPCPHLSTACLGFAPRPGPRFLGSSGVHLPVWHPRPSSGPVVPRAPLMRPPPIRSVPRVGVYGIRR
jgi:hypothetical protein